MSAHRHQASYNGVTFNQVYTATNTGTEGPANINEAFAESDIRLEWLDPTRMSTQDMRELRQFQEGAVPNEIFEGIRTIHLGGKVYGSSPGDLEDKTQALHAALSPTRIRLLSTSAIVGKYPDEPPGVLPLDFTIDSASSGTGLDRRFYCRPNIGRPLVFGKRSEGHTRPWQAWLVAYDPRMYGQALHTQVLANLSGGTPAGNNTVNAGNEPSYPQIKVIMSNDGANAHTLTNTTTGQALVLDLNPTVSGGAETFWIFPERGEMVRPSDGNGRYAYRQSGFLDQLYLMAGTNMWTWTPNTNVTSVTFYWRDAYS